MGLPGAGKTTLADALAKKINAKRGNAVPKEYPITAPTPPQVAADAGPNKIHAPKADATKLVVSEKVPTDLLATK